MMDAPSHNGTTTEQETAFDRLVSIFDGTVLQAQAPHIIEEQCQSIQKTPNQLTWDDAGLIGMSLLSTVSEKLPSDEWTQLDQRLKSLRWEENTIEGKVRGGVLNSIMLCISHKCGISSIKTIRDKIKIPLLFREESWYPLAIMEDILVASNEIGEVKDGTRCRQIGQYVIKTDSLRASKYLFGTPQETDLNALLNLHEFFALSNFNCKEDPQTYSICFERANGKCVQNFLRGMVEEIMHARNNSNIHIKQEVMDRKTTIIVKLPREDM